MKPTLICSTCGTAYPEDSAPEICPLCLDERQWVPPAGQSWTKREELHNKHSVKLNRLLERLYEMEIKPMLAIGQRTLLMPSEKGMCFGIASPY
jgi:hypothetical protein